MGVVKQQSLRASTITYFGVFLGIINVFIVYPLFLDKESIGLIKSFESVALVLVPLIYLGFPFTISRFYPILKNTNKKKLKSGVTFMVLFLIFNSIIVTALFILFKDYISVFFAKKSPLLSEYIFLCIPVFLSMSWLVFLSSIASANLKLSIPKLLEKVLIRILHISIVIIFALTFIDVNTLYVAIAFSYLIPTLIIFYYLLKKDFIFFDFNVLNFKSQNFAEEKRYTKLLTLSLIGIAIISNAGVLIISSVLGLQYVAVFFISFYMGYILDVPSTNISMILRPVISNSLQENDIENVKKLYKKSSIIQTFTSAVLFILLFANIDDIFAIMPNGQDFIKGKWVVIIVSFGYVLKNILGCNFDILTMSKYFKLSVLTTSLMAIATITFYYVFTFYFGLIGAAVAAFLTTVFYSFFLGVIVYSKFKIIPFSIDLFKLITISVIIFMLSNFLPNLENAFFSISYKSIIIVSSYLFLVIKFKISNDIEDLFFKFIDKLKP